MHDTSVDLGDGTYAHLMAQAREYGGGGVGVAAYAGMPLVKKDASGRIDRAGTFIAVRTIYDTSLRAEDVCEPELLIDPLPVQWTEHIELTAKGTLGALR